MRRYVRQFALYAGLYLLGAMALNVGIDPHRTFGLFEPRELTPYNRQALEAGAKAEVARRGVADVVLLGDSRIMIGCDPTHPALAREGRVENLAFAGATVSEAGRMLELALERRPPRLVVWGIDAESLPALRSPELRPHTLETRLNPDLDLWSYYRSRLIGLRTTWEACDVIRRRWVRTDCPWNRHGQKIDWEVRAPNAWLANTSTLAPRLQAQRTWTPPEESGVEACAPLLARAQQAGARVVLCLPPTHAMFQETLYHRPEQRQFANDCLRDLLATVERLNAAAPESPPIEVWDFHGYTRWHVEEFPNPALGGATPTALEWHWDAVHFQTTLGDLMLDRMLDGSAEPAGFGARLTRETLALHLAARVGERERYHQTQPRQLATLAELDAGPLR